MKTPEAEPSKAKALSERISLALGAISLVMMILGAGFAYSNLLSGQILVGTKIDALSVLVISKQTELERRVERLESMNDKREVK